MNESGLKAGLRCVREKVDVACSCLTHFPAVLNDEFFLDIG